MPERQRPVILTVDDDAEVLRAIARDLRSRYADRHRIIAANSPEDALRTLEQLREKLQPVALLLVDQRMPGMTGVELLERARPMMPEAKRVLLTAYADTSAAIDAINRVGLHHYLLKPWHPPEQQLYPVLDEILEDWADSVRPGLEGLLLIDHHWSPRGHLLRDFLTRNQIPYRRLDIERDAQAKALVGPDPLPLVVLEDGTRIPDPEPRVLAERLGMVARPAQAFYDLLIVGGGPAGLAAAVYGASEGLKVAVVEREAPGGQAGTSSRIENYLGFPAGLTGGDLARRALAQARRFGAELLLTSAAESVRAEGPYRLLRLTDGSEISCHALLVASGVSYREHEAPGVRELTGVGVYYGAALTEAIEYRDGYVFVIGAGNSAGQGALFLAQHARSVTLLCRGPSIAATMSDYLVRRLEQTPNMRLLTRTVLAAVHGDHRVEAVTLRNDDTGADERLRADAVFIYIGAVPCTEWLGDAVVRDARGFVLTGRDLPLNGDRPVAWPLAREPFLTETSLPGVFAAGDVRGGSVKRVASAVGEGSITVQFVHQHLAQL